MLPCVHCENSKRAVTACPRDSIEQMDPWISSLSVPIPQASFGIEKKSAYLISVEGSLGNFQFWAFKFQWAVLILDLQYALGVGEWDYVKEWGWGLLWVGVVFSQGAGALAHSADLGSCRWHPRAGGKQGLHFDTNFCIWVAIGISLSIIPLSMCLGEYASSTAWWVSF